MIEVPSKEIAILKKQTTSYFNTANTLEIKTDEDAEKAKVIYKDIQSAEKLIEQRRVAITKPINDGLKSIRDLFKPFELSIESAKKMVNAKILSFEVERDAKIAKEQQRVEARIEKGTMKAETGARKMEEIGQIKNTVQISTRILKKVRVVDLSLVPLEYLLPDMQKITEAVIKQGLEIPGVEKYEEKILSGR